MHLHFQLGWEILHYNLLEKNEIALILQGDGDVPNAFHNIVIRLHGGLLQHINECHLTYLSLHYVLLLPYSELS